MTPESANSKRVALALAIVALGAIVALAVLLGGGSGGDSVGRVNGTLTAVEGGRLVMRTAEPLDGKTEVEFVVRAEDAPVLDLPHLEDHASGDLPTTIYYEKSGDRYYAVRAEDAPVGGPSGS